MKLPTYITICLWGTIIASCNNQDKKTGQDERIGTVTDTTSINNTIIDYYEKEYQKTNANDTLLQFNTDTIDGGIELKTNTETTGVLGPRYVIPLSDGYIKGDLNTDKTEDLIVPVYATGGGNTEWEELFIFLNRNNKLEFFRMYSSFELAHCPPKGSHDGQFSITEINKGHIVGQSTCYSPEDGHLSPSFSFLTKYKFENGLKFLSQEKIK